MAVQVFAYIVHKNGRADDSAPEMLAAARKLDPAAEVTAVVFGSGPALDSLCQDLARSYPLVWKVDHSMLSYPNAELIRPLCVRLLPPGAVVLLPHNAFGMDLGPGLAVKLGAAYAPDCLAFESLEDGLLTAVRQEYGGQVNVRVTVDLSAGGVITIRPGAFAPAEEGGGSCHVEDKTAAALKGGLPAVGRRFVALREAEVGDVDITKSEILVSCGRGFESEENLELAEELARAIGADVSCSRPVVDARWLDKSRQVGTSGHTVRPKVYLALGISGSFQHLAGIKGNPFMVAINTNPRAPIFQVADVGIVGDVLEYVPELTTKIKQMRE